jgi:hypothetical protein
MKPTWCVVVAAAAFNSRWLRGTSWLLTDDHGMHHETNGTNGTPSMEEPEVPPTEAPMEPMNDTNGTNGTMEPMNDTNGTNGTPSMEEEVPMDGSAVTHPPPQFVLDFCGPQAEQMLGDGKTIGCYGWVVQMHGCYTSCKQTADINTLEANVGGCLQAMCGYVPALICGARDGGGICSLDSDPEGVVEHCDKMCNHFSECVIFQTKGASPPNFPSGCATDGTTAALFEQCYDQCIGEDELSWSPTAEPTIPTTAAF